MTHHPIYLRKARPVTHSVGVTVQFISVSRLIGWSGVGVGGGGIRHDSAEILCHSLLRGIIVSSSGMGEDVTGHTCRCVKLKGFDSLGTLQRFSDSFYCGRPAVLRGEERETEREKQRQRDRERERDRQTDRRTHSHSSTGKDKTIPISAWSYFRL